MSAEQGNQILKNSYQAPDPERIKDWNAATKALAIQKHANG